jgi:hypothetical protein
MTTAQSPYPVQYPVQFAVDYPDRPLNRLTSFFRIFVIIPIWIVLGTVSGAAWEWTGGHSSMSYGGAGAGGVLFLGQLLMILFRQKPPVVVRLEPGTAAVHQPGVDLPGPGERHLPVHR